MSDFDPTPAVRRIDVTDEDMPEGVKAQPGIGDLEEEFRAVDGDLEDLHRRVGGVSVQFTHPATRVLSSAGRAAEATAASVAKPAERGPRPDGPADPGGFDVGVDSAQQFEHDFDVGFEDGGEM